MKKKLTIILAAAAAVLCACTQEETSRKEIRLNDMSYTLGMDSKTIKIENIPMGSNAEHWFVYSPSSATWLSHEPETGTKNLYVVVDANTSGEIRSSFIQIRCENKTQRILVTQDTEGAVEFSQPSLSFRYLSATQSVDITNLDIFNSVSVSPAVEDAGWISATYADGTVSITVAENPDTERREGKVIVSGVRSISGDVSKGTIAVIQSRAGLLPYYCTLPDFSKSNVYVVKDNTGAVIAHLAKEYLRKPGTVNAQAVVAYPVTKDVVDLRDGFVAKILLEEGDVDDAVTPVERTVAAPEGNVHGGRVSFNTANNTIGSYTPGSKAAAETIYIPGDISITGDYMEGCTEATVEPLLVHDVRMDETNDYPVVKIGTVYWLGKNLNTTYVKSGSGYKKLPAVAGSASQTDKTVARYCVSGYSLGMDTVDDPETPEDEHALMLATREKYGLLYSWLAIGGFDTTAEAGVTTTDQLIADNISPEGWTVPSTTEVTTNLAAYLGGMNASFMNRMCIHTTVSDILPADNNISGFTADMSSYQGSSGGWNATTFRVWARNYNSAGPYGKSWTAGGFNNQTDQIWRALGIRCFNNGAIKIK